jgi:hypothetical protein
MEHARTLLQDALEVLTAAASVTNPPIKEVLTRAALSATELAATELRRVFQPTPTPFTPILELTPIEPVEEESEDADLFEAPPTPNHSRPYLEFVAALVPVLRAANPADTQQTHIAHIGQLWQRHKNATTLQAAIAAATEEVHAA